VKSSSQPQQTVMGKILAIVAVLAFASGAHGSSVRVTVPPSAAIGDTVRLRTSVTFTGGERIKDMTWSKDERVFMSYSGTRDEYTFYPLRNTAGAETETISRDSTPQEVILQNVQRWASGNYQVIVSFVGPEGTDTRSTFNSQYSLQVGDASELGNRFGSGQGGRPVSTSSSTSISSSSGTGGTSGFAQTATGSFSPLDTRFGGGSSRPSGAGPGNAGALDEAVAALNRAQQVLQQALANLG